MESPASKRRSFLSPQLPPRTCLWLHRGSNHPGNSICAIAWELSARQAHAKATSNFEHSVNRFAQQPRAWDEGPPTSWGALTDGWQLALSAEKQAVPLNEQALVSLSVRNGTAAPAPVRAWTSQWMKVEFNITRIGGGGLIPPRPLKDQFDILKRSGGGGSVSQVSPGGTASFGRVNLRSLYDLGPNTYQVQALWRDPHRSWAETCNVISTEITISIVH